MLMGNNSKSVTVACDLLSVCDCLSHSGVSAWQQEEMIYASAVFDNLQYDIWLHRTEVLQSQTYISISKAEKKASVAQPVPSWRKILWSNWLVDIAFKVALKMPLQQLWFYLLLC